MDIIDIVRIAARVSVVLSAAAWWLLGQPAIKRAERAERECDGLRRELRKLRQQLKQQQQ